MDGMSNLDFRNALSTEAERLQERADNLRRILDKSPSLEDSSRRRIVATIQTIEDEVKGLRQIMIGIC